MKLTALLLILHGMNLFSFAETAENSCQVNKLFSGAPSTETSYNSEESALYHLIGRHIESEEVQQYLQQFNEPVIDVYYEDSIEYLFNTDGLHIRTNLKGIIEVIYVFNYHDESSTYKSFQGELPFGLAFTTTMDELTAKIGEGILIHRHGFYRRIFRWEFSDGSTLGIELELPRAENETIFIEQLTLSKD